MPLVDAKGAPVGILVKQIAVKGFPQFRFEYHPQVKKVYVVEIAAPRDAEGKIPAAVLAEHVADEGQAMGFVQTFLRGYRRGARGEIVAAA